MISQSFNTETGDLATFIEHCKRAETTDNINMAKFSASFEDSNNKKYIGVPRRLRNVRTAVGNVAKNPHFIVASTEKKIVTPQGSAKYSIQGMQINTSLSMAIGIARIISNNLISCSQKLPIKNPSMKI